MTAKTDSSGQSMAAAGVHREQGARGEGQPSSPPCMDGHGVITGRCIAPGLQCHSPQSTISHMEEVCGHGEPTQPCATEPTSPSRTALSPGSAAHRCKYPSWGGLGAKPKHGAGEQRAGEHTAGRCPQGGGYGSILGQKDNILLTAMPPPCHPPWGPPCAGMGWSSPKGCWVHSAALRWLQGAGYTAPATAGTGKGGGEKVTINHHQNPFWKRKDVTGPG